MTEKKHVAKTLKTVLDHPVMIMIQDKTSNISEVIQVVKDYWSYDMYNRRPGPAIVDGIFKGTDLDLACFLVTLAERGAVVNIPTYKSMRPTTIKEGQRISSKENRHGPIISLTSNKDVFSFGLKIMDANVMTTDSVGDYRTFSITDPSGDWYDGWESIQWDPSAKENAFLTENDIWTGARVIFSNFVHPNRWISLYGHHYFITKALVGRLTEEAAFYNKEIKRMIKEGIEFPSEGAGAPKVWPKTDKEAGKSVKFESLEVEIDLPETDTNFEAWENSQENLVELAALRKKLVYTDIPTLNFSCRATELAFFKNGFKADGSEKMPAWLSGGTKWDRNFKLPRKRIEWDRMKLVQPGVGELSVAIRKRVKSKSEIMAMDYNGGIQ